MEKSEPRFEVERTKPASWTADAKCLQVDRRTSEHWAGGFDKDRLKPGEAAKLCAGCPVLEQCLAAALETEGTLTARNRYGVAGGMSPAERAAHVFADKMCGNGHKGQMGLYGDSPTVCRACRLEKEAEAYAARRVPDEEWECTGGHGNKFITYNRRGQRRCLECYREAARNSSAKRKARRERTAA